jgi:hypothetical protein
MSKMKFDCFTPASPLLVMHLGKSGSDAGAAAHEAHLPHKIEARGQTAAREF